MDYGGRNGAVIDRSEPTPSLQTVKAEAIEATPRLGTYLLHPCYSLTVLWGSEFDYRHFIHLITSWILYYSVAENYM